MRPTAEPPAPWRLRVDALVWCHRAAPTAVDALPAPLRARRRLDLTLAALVRYADTPVGPYHEVLAAPAVLLELPLPAATVSFIAVDSPPSLAAGRRNWALPKTLADFDWHDDGLGATARADDWSLTARLRPTGPTLPFAAAATNRQMDPAGDELATAVWARGRARGARATVRVDGRGHPSWLHAGEHPALLVSGARMRIGRARSAGAPA